MGSRPDYIHRKFAPLLDKTLENAVSACIAREFPRIGGPRIRTLCAQMLLHLIDAHRPPRERVAHGQIVWMAVPLDHPPHRHQRIADIKLVPVVLVSAPAMMCSGGSIAALSTNGCWKNRCGCAGRRMLKAGLLSNCDLAELLAQSDSRIAGLIADYERRTDQLVPRRATLHDVGTALTHKRIICWKRYAEGKEPHLVAKETWHSLEAVDHYLGQYDRVRSCRLQGITPEQTAHTLACSIGLVHEYLRIDDELHPSSPAKENPT